MSGDIKLKLNRRKTGSAIKISFILVALKAAFKINNAKVSSLLLQKRLDFIIRCQRTLPFFFSVCSEVAVWIPELVCASSCPAPAKSLRSGQSTAKAKAMFSFSASLFCPHLPSGPWTHPHASHHSLLSCFLRSRFSQKHEASHPNPQKWLWCRKCSLSFLSVLRKVHITCVLKL